MSLFLFPKESKKRLRPGSIPSVYPKRKRDDLNEAFLETPRVSDRLVPIKREANRVLAEYLKANQVTDTRGDVPSSHDSEVASIYEPCGSSSDESRCEIESGTSSNPLEERKFIVSRSQLLDLFNTCKIYHRYAKADVQQVIGTMVRIAAECMFCGYSWQWCSQLSIGTIPSGNLALSASILFSGALTAKVLRVLKCMGVAIISTRTFLTHQSSILFPSIARVWDNQQKEWSG
ncbi:uncharacterized protein LOC133203337 [Saccostrea echinata]|uniref:uncharacterized protein LOC133203337 n=1 Tax=Saccostrea echinata TaxID=191078 RepID=UPI002A835EF9|nr:uncharacterized protein LOC133203337 [Saccostrea echinata]